VEGAASRAAVARHRARLALAGLHPDLRLVLDTCVVGARPGFVYVKNAKAACSAVTAAIHLWETGEAPGPRIHSAPGVVQGWHAYERLGREIPDPAVLKFSVVREPVGRAVSAFLYYFVEGKGRLMARHRPHLRAFGHDPMAPPERAFDVFLDYVEAGLAEDAKRMDVHFRPQALNLRPDLIDYGVLGRVESLDADLARLEERLGVPAGRRLGRAPRANAAKASFAPSPAQRARARDLYAMDFEAFGY
jgi:hypothetical protein